MSLPNLLCYARNDITIIIFYRPVFFLYHYINSRNIHLQSFVTKHIQVIVVLVKANSIYLLLRSNSFNKLECSSIDNYNFFVFDSLQDVIASPTYIHHLRLFCYFFYQGKASGTEIVIRAHIVLHKHEIGVVCVANVLYKARVLTLQFILHLPFIFVQSQLVNNYLLLQFGML